MAKLSLYLHNEEQCLNTKPHTILASTPVGIECHSEAQKASFPGKEPPLTIKIVNWCGPELAAGDVTLV
jgi:hypothetical protein